MSSPGTWEVVVAHVPPEEPPPDPQATPVEPRTALAQVAQPLASPVLVKVEPEGITMLPAESIVVVAVLPKRALLAVRIVVEAPPNRPTRVVVALVATLKGYWKLA